MRVSGVSRREAVGAAGFLAASAAAIAVVFLIAQRDSADPARCGTLIPLENRCCARGQELRSGRCSGRPASCPDPLVAEAEGCVAPRSRIAIAGGRLRAGAGDWEAEGRIQPVEAAIAPFELDAFEITESAYADCVEAHRCPEVERTGEPGRAQGRLDRAAVEAYCAFRGGRLPTNAEWTFAAAGSKSRRYPWGDTGAVCRRGFWGLSEGPCGFGFGAPEVVGAHPDGRTTEGVHDLAGNVAEWVAADREAPLGMVRGGSYRSALATDLRTWHVREVPPAARPPDIGGRCAYDTPVVPSAAP